MTRQYAHLGSASDWLTQFSHAARPTRSSTQIWVVTRYLYQNQMFRRYEVIEIFCLGGAELLKSAIQMENSCFIKIRCLGGAESAIQMENGCFYQNQVFRRCRVLKISYLDGKQLFCQDQVFRRCRVLKISYLDGKKRFLSKSGVQEVQSAQNQLFRWKTDVYQDQVFRRCRVLKISYLDGKQLFISKLRVQEVQSAQNQLFGWKTAVFIKIRCLGGAEESNLLKKFYFYI